MMEGYNPFSLEGKNILVTGASSGIGRGIAVACSKMGGNIIVNGRNESRLDETLSLMAEGEHQKIVADITKAEDLKSMVAALPKLDGIVHCAGIEFTKLSKQLAEADVDEVMNVNFKAPILLQSEILSNRRINKNASIIFISSAGAVDIPMIGNSLYCASKGALISYSNCLKLELAPRNIRVNCISPAMVWTDLVRSLNLADEDLLKDEQSYLLKRYGKPEDIAYLAIYLLSEASSWMTGNNIEITGGSPKK